MKRAALGLFLLCGGCGDRGPDFVRASATDSALSWLVEIGPSGAVVQLAAFDPDVTTEWTRQSEEGELVLIEVEDGAVESLEPLVDFEDRSKFGLELSDALACSEGARAGPLRHAYPLSAFRPRVSTADLETARFEPRAGLGGLEQLRLEVPRKAGCGLENLELRRLTLTPPVDPDVYFLDVRWVGGNRVFILTVTRTGQNAVGEIYDVELVGASAAEVRRIYPMSFFTSGEELGLNNLEVDTTLSPPIGVLSTDDNGLFVFAIEEDQIRILEHLSPTQTWFDTAIRPGGEAIAVGNFGQIATATRADGPWTVTTIAGLGESAVEDITFTDDPDEPYFIALKGGRVLSGTALDASLMAEQPATNTVRTFMPLSGPDGLEVWYTTSLPKVLVRRPGVGWSDPEVDQVLHLPEDSGSCVLDEDRDQCGRPGLIEPTNTSLRIDTLDFAGRTLLFSPRCSSLVLHRPGLDCTTAIATGLPLDAGSRLGGATRLGDDIVIVGNEPSVFVYDASELRP